MTKLFIVNKLDTKLDLKGGYINLPIGGYAPIHPSDESDPSVVWAVTRKWAEITDKEPEGKPADVQPVDIEVTKPYEGMTAEELKADADKPIDAEVTKTEEAIPAEEKVAKKKAK